MEEIFVVFLIYRYCLWQWIDFLVKLKNCLNIYNKQQRNTFFGSPSLMNVGDSAQRLKHFYLVGISKRTKNQVIQKNKTKFEIKKECQFILQI